MSTILVLTSSVLGSASASNALIEEAVARLTAADPAAVVTRRDLGASPVPHLDFDAAAAIRGGDPANDRQISALALSDELVAELKAADTIVIGAPMYNFGIASSLTAWFDHVLRAGITFRYTEAGPEGLVKGKRAIVVLSRGGLYSEGPAAPMDQQEPHLRTLLGFIGIDDVTWIRTEKLGFGPQEREASIARAGAAIARAVPVELARAA